MNCMQRFSILFFLALGVVQVYAQTELVLRKGYSARVIDRYRTGDSLRFQISGSDDIYKGIIEILGDSTIFIAEQTVPYDQITAVYKYRNSWSRQVFLKGLPIAAAQASMFLFVYGNINAVVYGLWSKEYLLRATLISAGMLSGSWIVSRIYHATHYKKCSMNRYRLIKITYP